jgi:tetratricopeptide (TPR) repeat protein
LKQFGEAQTALEKSLKLRPDPDSEFLLGLTLNELGNRAAAIQALQRAIELRSNFAAAYTALGTAYREDEKYTEARSTLERAVELNSKDLRAHYQLGLVYAKLGNKEAAQKMLARADELRGEERKQEVIVYKLVEVP